jgi:hypothetical protein
VLCKNMTTKLKMNFGYKILSIAALLLAASCLFLLFSQQSERQVIEVSYVEFQAALKEELYVSNSIGMLHRVQLEDLTVSYDEALIIRGSGNWFSFGAGGFTLPHVSLIARLPNDVSDWSVADGKAIINWVEVLHAYREPFGSVKGRDEVQANLDAWEGFLQRFLQRLDVFEADFLKSGDWRVVAVEARLEGLHLVLEN